MAKSSKDIQLSELKDMISQLNTTIKTLNDTIARHVIRQIKRCPFRQIISC